MTSDPAALAFLDMALEELHGQAPDAVPARANSASRVPSPRTALAAAALMLVGAAVVVAVGLLERGSERRSPAATQGEKPPSMAASAYFPLALGARWEYRERTGDRERTLHVAATAARQVQGDVVVQLTELGGERPAFSFWSSDNRGVHRHGSTNFVSDPAYAPAAIDGVVLPSPLGAETAWTWRELPDRNLAMGVAVNKLNPVEAARPCRATLLGASERVQIGDQTWSCAHVRVDTELAAGVREEHRFYARGVGLVRATSKVGDGGETVRELVQFTPAAPLPDRGKVLAPAIGSRPVTWIELPSQQVAAWVLRSSFAAVTAAGHTAFYRVFGDHAVPFDPDKLDDFVDLAKDEDFAPRLDGLFPQQMSIGLCELAAHLHAARLGLQVARVGMDAVRINVNATKASIHVTLQDADGKTTKLHVEVATQGGVPTSVEIQ